MKSLQTLITDIEKEGGKSIVIDGVSIELRDKGDGVDIEFGMAKGFLTYGYLSNDEEKKVPVKADRLYIISSYHMNERLQHALDTERIAKALGIPKPEASPLIEPTDEPEVEPAEVLDQKDVTIAALEAKIELFKEIIEDRDLSLHD